MAATRCVRRALDAASEDARVALCGVALRGG
jgi:hypothetical protein